MTAMVIAIWSTGNSLNDELVLLNLPTEMDPVLETICKSKRKRHQFLADLESTTEHPVPRRLSFLRRRIPVTCTE